ncbi:hypothetical protein LG413_15285 [Acetobacter persici]|nr:hypothetical protein [Acetobacter persici]
MPVSALMPKPRTVKKTAKAPKAQLLMLSGALKRFVLNSPHASADTKKATQRAVDLFLQAFGDAPVSIIGGEKAGAFRDLLFSLPASLGKRKSTLTLEEETQRASGIDTAYGRQKVIKELYDGFFQTAFPKLKERLGIVYTPLEVVDFIIRSINDILEREFGQTLGSKGVHIMDPFTGTGTFITRLLQSGLITKEQLLHKYRQELHANEIVLLAY